MMPSFWRSRTPTRSQPRWLDQPSPRSFVDNTTRAVAHVPSLLKPTFIDQTAAQV
jgi:hypothetical protein